MSAAISIFHECFEGAVVKLGDPVPVLMSSFNVSYKEGGPRLYNNAGNVLLTLSPEAEGTLPQTRFQAAHEAVHVLCGLTSFRDRSRRGCRCRVRAGLR